MGSLELRSYIGMGSQRSIQRKDEQFSKLNSKKESGVSRMRKGLVSQHEKLEKEE